MWGSVRILSCQGGPQRNLGELVQPIEGPVVTEAHEAGGAMLTSCPFTAFEPQPSPCERGYNPTLWSELDSAQLQAFLG